MYPDFRTRLLSEYELGFRKKNRLHVWPAAVHSKQANEPVVLRDIAQN